MKWAASLIMALSSSAAAVAGLSGTVFFTYDDPEGTPREFMYTAGNANNDGTITFNTSSQLDLVVDAQEPGFGVVTYVVTLSLDMTVGQATLVSPGVWQAPVDGSFAFNDGVDDILTGTVMDGAFLTFGTTGNVNASSSTLSLMMTASGQLLAQFGGAQLSEAFDASWSLADFLPGAPSVNSSGYLQSFVANSAFVGSAFIVPAPGGAALLGLAGLVALPRRRS